MVGGEAGFEGLKAGARELFAFEAGEERGEELQIFEGVLGGVKDGIGSLAEERSDDGFDDDDGEEGSFGSELGPYDGRRDGCDGEEEREPTEPGAGKLIWAFGPLGERIGVNAYLEVFAQYGDVLAKVEAVAEFGNGGVALGKLGDG